MSRDIPIPANDREEAEKSKAEQPKKPATLLEAILAVQRAAPKLQKNAINPHFKSRFISLDTLMGEVMPLVNGQDLVWLTLPGRDEHGPTLDYQLIHAPSGEKLDGRMSLMLAKADPQGQGSAITYARRYSLMAVLGLVADEDDDGNSASRKADKPAARKPANGSTPPAFVKALRDAYKASGLTEGQFRLHLVAVGVENVEDLVAAVNQLTPEQADDLAKRLAPNAA
jgi:hypothetical protein